MTQKILLIMMMMMMKMTTLTHPTAMGVQDVGEQFVLPVSYYFHDCRRVPSVGNRILCRQLYGKFTLQSVGLFAQATGSMYCMSFCMYNSNFTGSCGRALGLRSNMAIVIFL